MSQAASPASQDDTPLADNPLRGIALSVGACLVFAIADTTSKFLGTGLPIVEIAWIRYVLFLILAAALAARATAVGLNPAPPTATRSLPQRRPHRVQRLSRPPPLRPPGLGHLGPVASCRRRSPTVASSLRRSSISAAMRSGTSAGAARSAPAASFSRPWVSSTIASAAAPDSASRKAGNAGS